MSWRVNALCRGADVRLFYTQGVTRKEVVQMCEECPVLEQCAKNALYNEAFGYQGGMTEKERFHKRRELGIPEPEKNDDMRRTVMRRKNGTGTHPNDIIHGTRKGYLQEVNIGMPTCQECKQANREFMRKYKEKRRTAA